MTEALFEDVLAAQQVGSDPTAVSVVALIAARRRIIDAGYGGGLAIALGVGAYPEVQRMAVTGDFHQAGGFHFPHLLPAE